MRRYVILNRPNPFANHGRAMVVTNPDFDGEWWNRYFPNSKWDVVDAVRIDDATGTKTPVMFNEELAGPDGMSFMLIQGPGMTDEHILAAMQWLRRRRDVVRFHVLRIDEWLSHEEAVA
jgi:hypothetical protein